MSDTKQGNFVQFPLCVLATRRPFLEWLSDGFCYGVRHYMLESAEGKESATKALERARNVIGFNGGSFQTYCESYERVEHSSQQWMIANGKTFPVRLFKEYYFETRDKAMLTEIQMRIFLGLNSLIGMKDYAKAGWPMIQARAAGWLRPLTEAEKALSVGVGPIYSRGQIDRACQELIARGLMAEFTFNRGERWWSNKLTADELAKSIAKRKTWRLGKNSFQVERNQAVSQAIIEARKLGVSQLNKPYPVPVA